ncbi:triose-phosphate transporter family-domain-containing protein [Aspergillus cavernicola]|uniref:Triose-phosphate transporter family-domain-containing protein n=1 Tax=Aspergillus cavernicola TaxID=176166 RepID=A0ABR4J4R2_9EURO
MSSEEKVRTSGEVSRPEPTLPTVNPAAEKSEPPKATFHPAVYVATWITLSSSVILFNKHILDYANFRFPIILTTWHLAFATMMTQILARGTNLLDGRKTVKMTGRVYLRAIVPIGIFFSLSLICGNVTYLYLSVAFIQMLKATTPVAVLLATWGMGMAPVNLKVLTNVGIIVVGVIIASFGEIKFVFIGFLFQIGGIIFEATRLVMVQRLLSSAEFKMDPLVSLYYFAPVCAVMNGVTALFLEVPYLTMDHIYNVGLWTLLANAVVAFLLNVSVVFLIGKTSSLVMTLCGVLKDILLVAASMMIWQTPVTPLQFFGYSIALIGLVYYKLGGEKIKEYTGHANRAWAEYGATRPTQRRFVIIGAALLSFFLLVGSMAPSYAPESVASVKGILGGASAGNA